VCRLKKSFYVLKKSPRAWFDRINEPFSVWVTKKCNGGHSVFYRHSESHITIPTGYMDDSVITIDDNVEISQSKVA
jgi:hypothetical protein